jgi:hypothetical protein
MAAVGSLLSLGNGPGGVRFRRLICDIRKAMGAGVSERGGPMEPPLDWTRK